MTSTIITRLETAIKSFEFTNYSYTPLKKPLSLAIYEDWLKQGHNAEMSYLKRHLPEKSHPQKKWPQAKSVIVIAQNYLPHPAPSAPPLPLKEVKIAKYAQGMDYHHWFTEKLEQLCVELRQAFPAEEFIAVTDSAPLMERNWAYESGLGWFGKNSCLLNQNYGSYHFLGEVITSLSLDNSKELHSDLCGKCTRCIEACPTEALSDGKTLDSNKCISYWTIETRKTPPRELITNFSNWLFGCDTCQEVCPWNIKAFQLEKTEKAPDKKQLEKDVQWLLQQSNKALLRTLKGTALLRTGPIGLKKNAIAIAGNFKLTSLASEITNYLNHPTLGEVSHWALAEFEIPDKIME